MENPYFLSKSLYKNSLELFKLVKLASTLRLTGKNYEVDFFSLRAFLGN